ncbi:MAG: nickel pincer cofactor biosynthesis protein LarC, partial [Defluviitaleaceae bacterium]|nr:nickel pincer cofactor biosynthesis protein LarC [Defluviitaleaceae bacterium]
IYQIIAEAEAEVHGEAVSAVHFHEVGAMDAVADITAVCMLIEELAPQKILASAIHAGSGSVKCAHGVLPVPAPATALILTGVPVYGGEIKGELCTPTGAAVLKKFVSAYGAMPLIEIEKIGYGMGKKDFEAVNCVRVFLGETRGTDGSVTELLCNIDDMTPEALAFAQQLLLNEGALDVSVVPALMKKGRQGFVLNCMCSTSDRSKMLGLLFKHTSTIGVREYESRRHVLYRESETRQTPYGSVRYKISSGFGIKKTKPEFDDLAKIAVENGLPLDELQKKLAE